MKIKKSFEYTLRKSSRARRLRITVRGNGSVVVTVPRFVSKRTALSFLEEKAGWVEKNVKEVRKANEVLGGAGTRKQKRKRRGTRSDYVKHKEKARALVHERLEYFNKQYGYTYNRVAIRNQKTRWGSCSKKGNLNFNYQILFLPSRLCDYIIVHELCHLKELNHSARFWALVEKTVPNHKQLRKELRQYTPTLL